jgi:hypothetical protein
MAPQEIARPVGNHHSFHDLPLLTDLEREAVAAQLPQTQMHRKMRSLGETIELSHRHLLCSRSRTFATFRLEQSKTHILSCYTLHRIPGTKWKPGYRVPDEHQANCQHVPDRGVARSHRRSLEARDFVAPDEERKAAPLQTSSTENASDFAEGAHTTTP